jgi:hypothetical protein
MKSPGVFGIGRVRGVPSAPARASLACVPGYRPGTSLFLAEGRPLPAQVAPGTSK